MLMHFYPNSTRGEVNMKYYSKRSTYKIEENEIHLSKISDIFPEIWMKQLSDTIKLSHFKISSFKVFKYCAEYESLN